MSFNIVSFCSGGYLYAIAHLGVFAVVPNISLNFKLSTFITAPSIPNVSVSLISPIFFIAFFTSSKLLQDIRTGFTLNPKLSKYSNSSKCELNSFPSIFCTLKMYISNGLFSVILLSNCLSEPAAALRAFANNSSSFSSLS